MVYNNLHTGGECGRFVSKSDPKRLAEELGVAEGAIPTTEASEAPRAVHDRTPVILHPEDYAVWLGGGE